MAEVFSIFVIIAAVALISGIPIVILVAVLLALEQSQKKKMIDLQMTYGERSVDQTLMNVTGKKAILRNLYLPGGEGTVNSEQVGTDILMIHETGLYIIRYINAGGQIYGNEYDPYWFCGQNGFPNPIGLNRRSAAALDTLINSRFPIYSVVAFSDGCELNSLAVTSSDVCILRCCELPAFLDGVICRNVCGCFISDDEIRELYDLLVRYSAG